MAAGITDVLNINDMIGTIIAESVIKFQKVNVMWSLMRKKQAMKGANTVLFPILTIPTEADVDANASGAEETTATMTKLDSTGVSLEILRYAISVGLTDLSSDGSAEDMINIASSAVGNALSQKFDNLACALGDGFATSVGSDTLNITLAMFFDAVGTLKAANAPTFSNGNYAAILHPKQIWGAYGITNFLGAVINPIDKTNELLGSGYVTTLAGCDIFWSSEIPLASNIADGMVIGPEALGVAWKDMGGNGSFLAIEAQREALTASTNIVGNGYFAVKELVDTYGVQLQSLIVAEAEED